MQSSFTHGETQAQSPGHSEPGSPDGSPLDTRSRSNSPSPSLQLEQDLLNSIRIQALTSPREDDLQLSGPSRSRIIEQANNARSHKNTNYDNTGAGRKLKSTSKRRRSQPRNFTGTHFSPLNGADSIRLTLLRTLIKKNLPIL